MNETNTEGTKEEKVEEIAETLHIVMPTGNLPLLLKIISLFTLIGGLGIISSLFVDIIQPSASIQSKFYLLRLLLGVLAIGTAYGLIKKRRWTMWVYGVLTLIGLLLNPITALIPGVVLIYLYLIRKQLKPSFLDILISEIIKSIASRRNHKI